MLINFTSAYSFYNHPSVRSSPRHGTFKTHIPLLQAVGREMNSNNTHSAKTKRNLVEEASLESISFEYCTGCRWLLRSLWMTQEILTTFEKENLSSVTLIPSRSPTGGVFRVSLKKRGNGKGSGRQVVELDSDIVLWDREEEKCFPESKKLKQLIRNALYPNKDLGHSESIDRKDQSINYVGNTAEDVCEECREISPKNKDVWLDHRNSPNISVFYCVKSKYLACASWIVQEILSTFQDDVNSATLVPSLEKGKFIVTLDNVVIWDKKERNRLPDIDELKRVVSNYFSSDVSISSKEDESTRIKPFKETLDDDEAAEMRNFYGVL